VRNPVPPLVRVWQWGIALIVAVGLLGACPFLTGTPIPFFLVCFQASVLLTLVALTIIAKVWLVLPLPLKLLVLLTVVDHLAERRKQRAQEIPTIPAIPVGNEQQWNTQYDQPSTNYPEMLPPQ